MAKVVSAEKRLNDILESISARITPTPDQHAEIDRILKRVVAKANAFATPQGIHCTIAGSFIRNTYMLDKREFDLFLMFPEETTRESLEKKGLELGKRIISSLHGKAIVAYAEHPYIRGKVNGFDVDIVPAYAIKDASKIRSAVDRTPFHNLWLQKHLSPRLVAEVRLLKQFLKGQGLYGSDTKTEGFSGYLCELLMVEHKYFVRLMKAAASWKPGDIFIDVGARHGSEAERHAARKRFSGQPLVAIDPVDPNRNVASVLSTANFVRFVSAAGALLSSPSEQFFFPKRDVDLKKLAALLKSRGTEFLAVDFASPGVLPDILYPQLRRTAQRLVKVMRENEFAPIGFDVFSNGRSCIFIELEVWSLPRVRKLEGPPVFSKPHAKEFVEKYSRRGRVWTEGDRYVAEVKRDFTKADGKMKEFLGCGVATLKEKGVASYVAESMGDGFRILGRDGVMTKARKDHAFALFLWEYFHREFY